MVDRWTADRQNLFNYNRFRSTKSIGAFQVAFVSYTQRWLGSNHRFWTFHSITIRCPKTMYHSCRSLAVNKNLCWVLIQKASCVGRNPLRI